MDTITHRHRPQIVDDDSAEAFRQQAIKMGLAPDSLWVGGYVDYEWDHVRHLFMSYEKNLNGKRILEVGCNIGASAIVLASLGAEVVAFDVNPNFIALAEFNARRYGLSDKITFHHIQETSNLPFKSNAFDIVNCNSVLEYVPTGVLEPLLQELSRMVGPGGRIFISGTSNRIWPKEVHSQAWFINYIPRFLDKLLFSGKQVERGISPWRIMRGFQEFRNADLQDRGRHFLRAKEAMGVGSAKRRLIRTLITPLGILGVWVGFLLPNIQVVLIKSNASH